MTGLDAAAQPGGPLPRGLTVVLAVTGLLVSVLAQWQFGSILGPVLLPLILVIGVHPMTEDWFSRCRAPQWLAVTGMVIALVAVILGLARQIAPPLVNGVPAQTSRRRVLSPQQAEFGPALDTPFGECIIKEEAR